MVKMDQQSYHHQFNVCFMWMLLSMSFKLSKFNISLVLYDLYFPVCSKTTITNQFPKWGPTKMTKIIEIACPTFNLHYGKAAWMTLLNLYKELIQSSQIDCTCVGLLTSLVTNVGVEVLSGTDAWASICLDLFAQCRYYCHVNVMFLLLYPQCFGFIKKIATSPFMFKTLQELRWALHGHLVTPVQIRKTVMQLMSNVL